MNRPRRIGTALASTALVLVAAACGSDDTGSAASEEDRGEVTLGAAISETGYLASFDKGFMAGAEIAIDELNDDSEYTGPEMTLVKRDVASAAAGGVNIVNQLLNADKVDALLLGASSAVTQATAPLVQPKNFPVVSLGAVPPTVDWVQQIQPPLLPGAVDSGVEYLGGEADVQSVAIVYSQSPLGQRFADVAKQKAEAAGMKVVDSIGIEATATDLSTQALKIQQSGAQGILNYLSGPSGIVFAKAEASVGLGLPDMVSAQDGQTFQQIAAEYPESLYIALPSQACDSIPDEDRKTTCETLVETSEKENGDGIDLAYLAQGYDAIRLIAQALEEDPENLKDALSKNTMDGINAQYDYNGDATGVKASPNRFRIAKADGDALEVLYNPEEA